MSRGKSIFKLSVVAVVAWSVAIGSASGLRAEHRGPIQGAILDPSVLFAHGNPDPYSRPYPPPPEYGQHVCHLGGGGAGYPTFPHFHGASGAIPVPGGYVAHQVGYQGHPYSGIHGYPGYRPIDHPLVGREIVRQRKRESRNQKLALFGLAAALAIGMSNR